MSDPIKLAMFKKNNIVFQIDIDPDLAMDYRRGKKDIEMHDILKAERIFVDARRGLKASSNDLISAFGTDDVFECAKQIIMKGEVQVTAEYRNKEKELKRKEILTLVQRNAIDPTTKLPHPLTRIENAFEEAKVKIDDRKSAKDQLEHIVKQLRVVLPIRFETKKIIVVLPSNFAGKVHGQIRDMGKLIDETWGNDGSVRITFEIPAGILLEVYDKINALTHGQAEIKDA